MMQPLGDHHVHDCMSSLVVLADDCRLEYLLGSLPKRLQG